MDILGVVKLVDPFNSNVPPVEALYQSILVPAALDAEIFTVPGPQVEPFTGVVGTAGSGFTVAVICILGVEIQPVVVFLATTK